MQEFALTQAVFLATMECRYTDKTLYPQQLTNNPLSYSRINEWTITCTLSSLCVRASRICRCLGWREEAVPGDRTGPNPTSGKSQRQSAPSCDVTASQPDAQRTGPTSPVLVFGSSSSPHFSLKNSKGCRFVA